MADRALGRRTFGWMMFDWATQPFYTLLLTFVFGPYLAATAAELFASQGLGEEAARARAQSVWSGTQALVGVAIALAAPVLGAFADAAGRRAAWVAGLSVPYVLACAGLWILTPDGDGLWTALVLFGAAMIAAEFATVLTNAILPELTGGDPAWMGRVSGTGYALGYAGGIVSLLLVLAFLAETEGGRTLIGRAPAFGLDPEAREGTRAVGPLAAAWYVVFMVPFFALVRDAPARGRPGLGAGLAELRAALAGAARRPSLRAYLIGSMLYRDALAALYAFGGTYAVLVLDWSITQVGGFGVIGAATAAVASWIGGRLDGRHGPRPVVAGCIILLALASVAIAATSRGAVLGLPVAPGSSAPDLALYFAGAVIGGAGGALQAASRTLMARHAEPGRPAEAFGLYALAGKATAFVAPALVALVTQATGSARLGALPIAAMFLVGLAFLAQVRPEGDVAGTPLARG